MSFNELHITRANYEEFFLLYVDGELTAAQNDAVEAFAAQHPDLQEELDALLTTKLDAEPVFFNKESLLADSMKHSTIDESLLLYIDNELNAEEKKVVEEKLANDTTFQFQHHLLLQTKLTAQTISYPDKAELYRKEERTIRPVLWYRVAAAVFVLLAAGYMWSLSDNVAPTTEVAVQTKNTPSTATTTQPALVTPPSSVTVHEPVAVTTTSDNNNEAIVNGSKAIETKALTQRSTTVASTSSDIPAEASVAKTTTVTVPAVTERNSTVNLQQQNLNNQAVTTTPAIAYHTTEATDNQPGQSDAVAIETENNKKSGSVKGFLRKATRFIERRTGVSATNENDELLIGALAINLK